PGAGGNPLCGIRNGGRHGPPGNPGGATEAEGGPGHGGHGVRRGTVPGRGHAGGLGRGWLDSLQHTPVTYRWRLRFGRLAMGLQIIRTDPELSSYTQRTVLDGREYLLEFQWNQRAEKWGL